ncbi:ArsC family reductase [Hahella sp. CR1]|uniref:ArsC family reductase n=1 Tax=Hahella sp. CR1 TaxID=2992807 RepID=UPI00244369A0|nr:ArsC family reductase [Hahella sp. CR1]MDG9668267.1 ArsC family reductase [Hahella sp. CR1]
MSLKVYGISNCDTVKKARKWLEANSIEYTFHDFKKSGVPQDNLEAWLNAVGVETLVNKRGTTWRKLSDSDKSDIESGAKTKELLSEHSSVIKRPVIETPSGDIITGFTPSQLEKYA